METREQNEITRGIYAAARRDPGLEGRPMAEYTRTPWKHIRQRATDARFIVRAVNSHDQLVEALEQMADYYARLPQFRDRGHDIPAELAAARAALDKAKES